MTMLHVRFIKGNLVVNNSDKKFTTAQVSMLIYDVNVIIEFQSVIIKSKEIKWYVAK
jgi:hypothetical protein